MATGRGWADRGWAPRGNLPDKRVRPGGPRALVILFCFVYWVDHAGVGRRVPVPAGLGAFRRLRLRASAIGGL